MKKSNVIASAILGICLSASLIAGGTYALFTSEDEVNIVVKSGKVDVTAVVDQTSIQTKQLNQGYELGDNHTLGGEISLLSDGSLSLARFMPGDGAKFNINIQNNSDVPVKYRTVVTKADDTGLFSALTITLGTETFLGVDGEFTWKINSEWKTLNPIEGTNKTAVTFPVSVEFAESADSNQYEGTSCKIVYRVEAVQGNADTVNEPNEMYICSKEDFNAFVKNVNEGKTYAGRVVHLGGNVDLEGASILPLNNFAGTFDGNNYSISNFKMADQYVGLFGNVSNSVNVKNLTIRNATFEGTGSGSAGGALFGNVRENISVKSENIRLENVTIRNVEYGGGIVGKATGTTTIDSTFVSDIHVTPSTYAGGVCGYYDGDELEIREIAGDFDNTSIVEITSTSSGGCASILGYQEKGNTATIKGSLYDFMKYDESKGAWVYAITCENQTNNYIGSFTQSNIYLSRFGEGFYYTSDSGIIDEEIGLQYFRDYVNSGEGLYLSNVKLECDVDLKNEPFTPIYGFVGTFNGNGHTISNLLMNATDDIDTSGEYGKGLFATGGKMTTYNRQQLYKFMKVENLTIENAFVSGNDNVGVVFGGGNYSLKGKRNSYDLIGGCVLENVTLKGKVMVNGKNNVGAFAGKIEATNYVLNNYNVTSTDILKNCIIAVEEESYVKGTQYVGGMIGHTGENETTSIVYIKNCISNINVTAENNVGGIVGLLKTNVTVEGCTLTNATITASLGSDASEIKGTGEGTFNNCSYTNCTINKQ